MLTAEKIKEVTPGVKFHINNTFPEIKLLEALLNEAISDSEGAIHEMCAHLTGSGGKRIRPLLVLYSGLAFGKPAEGLEKAAIAAELIHMATLAHDDIIDDSDMRRGRPTINNIWGNHAGVLCGDFLFARAFQILSDNRLYESLSLMVEAIDSMCHGEIMQAENCFNPAMDIETYYSQITRKTAKFLECCCKSGASVTGADENGLAAVGEYGLNLGLAFQIIDDILDYTGSESIMGKPGGEDLRHGIITMPLILLKGSEKHRSAIYDIIEKKSFTERELAAVRDLLESSGSIEKSHRIAMSHIDQALWHLKALPDTPYRKAMSSLAEALRYRDN